TIRPTPRGPLHNCPLLPVVWRAGSAIVLPRYLRGVGPLSGEVALSLSSREYFLSFWLATNLACACGARTSQPVRVIRCRPQDLSSDGLRDCVLPFLTDKVTFLSGEQP